MVGIHRLKKILVANRGEIAIRVFRTCKEIGIRTVAVFSDADRRAPHVLMADEAYHIGPPPSRESYLHVDAVIEAARLSHADGVHPGYGFLSENEEFARRVHQAGMVFIGPSAESIRLMGDKTQARKLVAKAGVLIVPGTTKPIANQDDAIPFVEAHGFPVLIKAAGGGGGKGMRVVRSLDEFSSAFRSAQSEALTAFGDSRVYLERYLDHPRHIEFQILADAYGNTIHLGERECSIQRRHQKVIEESPSPIVDESMRQTMGEVAVVAARSCRYVNAGTIEFLVDRNLQFYFLEMNTRLQVEHAITEMRTGIDLVAEQIRIAEGEPLSFSQQDVTVSGHAMECRIYAEDPRNNYLPSTGRIHHLKPSQGFSVRDDRGVEAGNEVTVYYDPMISKLIVWGRSREEARRRMLRSLRDYEVLGVETNIPLNIAVLEHPRFIEGNLDTHFLDECLPTLGDDQLASHEETAAVAVATLLHAERSHDTRCSFLSGSKDSSRGMKPSPQTVSHKQWRSTRLDHMRGSQ